MTGLRFLSSTLILFAAIQSTALAAGNLIQEVSALEVPERFKPRSVDDIVMKYVGLGIPRDKVKEILDSEGFKVSEPEKSKPLADCHECDRTVVVGRHDHRPMFSFVYDYGIVVEVGFKDGKSAVVHGWYVQNVY